MAKFVILCNFTDQGIRNVKDSPDRLTAFQAMLQTLGVSMTTVYYTEGPYDIVSIVNGPADAITAAILKLGTLGNIRTLSMRAHSPDEMKEIIGKMP